MNIEKKILRLLEHGFNTSTLADLKPKQIEALYNRLVEAKEENKEAVTTKSSIESTKYTNSEIAAMKTKGQGLKVDGEVLPTADGGLEVIKRTGTAGSETTESNNQFTQSSKFASGEDPQQDVPQDEGPSDNMNANDGMGMFEENLDEKFESKKQQKYFFSKCGDGKTKEQKKWCKMAKEFADSTKNFSKLPDKKDETNEEFSFKDYMGKIGSVVAGNTAKNVSKTLKPTFEGKLEESIMKMINKHITPKMTKKDFIKTIMESEREVETPVKPDVDTPSRPKPATPYQPKHKPAPKAGEREVETPVKPDVDTPSRPKPATPYQPKHKPAPKAEDIPQWLTFDAIGINFK
jgi:hypothetical protein